MKKVYLMAFALLLVAGAGCGGPKKSAASDEVIGIIDKVNNYWQTNHPTIREIWRYIPSPAIRSI